MQNPAFPVLFPNLAQLTNELTQLQQLLTQQGITLPGMTRDLNASLYYIISAWMLLPRCCYIVADRSQMQ